MPLPRRRRRRSREQGPNGKALPVRGRDYNLLLLTRTYVRKIVKLAGGRQVLTPSILIRSVRQNIKRYWHLIDDETMRFG